MWPLGQEHNVDQTDLIVPLEQPPMVDMSYGQTESAGNRANRCESQQAAQMKGQART